MNPIERRIIWDKRIRQTFYTKKVWVEGKHGAYPEYSVVRKKFPKLRQVVGQWLVQRHLKKLPKRLIVTGYSTKEEL